MRKAATPAALVLLLALAAGTPAQDSPSSREHELESIRGEIARLTARLETVKESAAGIAGDLDRLELELELQSQKVAEAASAKELKSGTWLKQADDAVQVCLDLPKGKVTVER